MSPDPTQTPAPAPVTAPVVTPVVAPDPTLVVAPVITDTPIAAPLVATTDVGIMGTTALDFGPSGKLTGITLLGSSQYGPDGEEVLALIPVSNGYVQLIVPARFVVK